MKSRSMSFLREQLKDAGFNAEEVSPNEWSMFARGCSVTVNINDYDGTFQIYIVTPDGGCIDIPDTDVFEDDESANLIVEPPGEKRG